MGRPQELVVLLRHILGQAEGLSVEIVIVDSSFEKNIQVAEMFQSTVHTYDWTGVPKGVDADFNRAVSIASGKYCWLLPDDDELVPDAIASISNEIEQDFGLILLNAIVYDDSMSQVLQTSMVPVGAPEFLLGPLTAENLVPFSRLLSYIGSVVIRRNMWNTVVISDFFGTEFAHVGLLLTQPPDNGIRFISRPMIRIRYGHAHWEGRYAKIWWKNWEGIVARCISDRETQIAWGVSRGWTKIRDAVYTKALDFANDDELRERLLADKSFSFIQKMISRIVLAVPRLTLNNLLTLALKLRRKENLGILTYNLKRRRADQKNRTKSKAR
jgi:glycosyltransferase involved in cell wall biosynthesis